MYVAKNAGGYERQVGSRVHIVGDRSFNFTDNSGNVSSVPRAGGTPLKLAWSQANPGEVAVTPTDVYWALGSGFSPGPLWKVPLGGGMWTNVEANASRLVVDGASLYAVTQAGLSKMPIAGGAFVSLTPSKSAAPDAIDAKSIYWTESGMGVAKFMRLSPK